MRAFRKSSDPGPRHCGAAKQRRWFGNDERSGPRLPKDQTAFEAAMLSAGRQTARFSLWAPVQDEPRSHGFQAKPAEGPQQRALPKRMNDGVSCVLGQVLNPMGEGAPKNKRSARRHRCQEAANNEGTQNTSVPPAGELSKRSLRVKDTRRRERGSRSEIATQRPSPCEGVPRKRRAPACAVTTSSPQGREGGHDQGGDVPRALLAEALHGPKLRGFTVTSRRVYAAGRTRRLRQPPSAAQIWRPLVVAARLRGGGTRRLFTLLLR